MRTRDNRALVGACASGGAVAGVFIMTPGQWREHDWGGAKVQFVLQSLAVLSEELGELRLPLLIRYADRFADVSGVLMEVVREIGVERVHCNREPEYNEGIRDLDVRRAAEREGVEFRSYEDQTVLPPGSVRTGSGGAYKVFTPFRKAWLRECARRITEGERATIEVADAPSPRDVCPFVADDVPDSVKGFELHSGVATYWPGGEREAASRLSTFVGGPIQEYARGRDRMALDATSGLSAHLSCGTVSVRTCLWAALGAHEAGVALLDDAGDKSGPGVWISELVWREFNRHLLVAFERLSKGRTFRPEAERVEWVNDESQFRAWCEARTGVPIIDASMRQLQETGWMHNRCRMIVAMFLTKNLLVDWRWGERFFMEHLVDADLANNNAGWQWAASTGTDAAPYFRVFNPVSQSARFDPHGRYIRRFMPELAALDDKAVHEPWRLGELERAVLEYPEPMVDLKESRARSIEVFRRALESRPA